MSNQQVIVVNIMKDICSKMSPAPNYQAGSGEQIVKTLNDLDNSITQKGLKYPLLAMVLPVLEKRGRSVGFYAKVTIPRIVIATISNYSTDDVLLRYDPITGVFPNILYPMYYDFLYQCGAYQNTNGQDPDSIEHSKRDCPNVRRLSSQTNDWVDYIEILNLELILFQIKTC